MGNLATAGWGRGGVGEASFIPARDGVGSHARCGTLEAKRYASRLELGESEAIAANVRGWTVDLVSSTRDQLALLASRDSPFPVPSPSLYTHGFLSSIAARAVASYQPPCFDASARACTRRKYVERIGEGTINAPLGERWKSKS